MEEFNKVACSIVDMMENLASFISDDECVKEYFIKHYCYEEEFEDATHHVLRYIEDKFF